MDHSRQPTAGSRRPAPVSGPARRLASAAVLGTRVHAAAAPMTAVTAIRETLTISGQYDQLRAARVFTRTALTEHHPCAAVAVLLVSELVTNSMLHSDSRLPGGTITITVTGTPDSARVEVRDAGGTSVPVLTRTDDTLAEGGRGLRLVRDLAARWAYRRRQDGLVTWFEVRADPLA